MEKAALIVATGCLVGSVWEGRHVFVWRTMPDKKALKLSGAFDAKVIIKFQCKATFVDDIGIVNPYVRQFGPLKSYFPGPIKISNIVVLPVV